MSSLNYHDLSEIELRFLTMCSTLPGKDLYKVEATKIFGVPYESVTGRQREYAKTVTFPQRFAQEKDHG